MPGLARLYLTRLYTPYVGVTGHVYDNHGMVCRLWTCLAVAFLYVPYTSSGEYDDQIS